MKKLFLLMTLTLGASQALPINHDFGTTEVPLKPKRVIVLEYSFLDMLAALHERPIATPHDHIPPSYLIPLLDKAADVGPRATPSLETIAQLKPDLIIADSFRHKAIYPQLQKIAPTIALDSYNGSYQDMTEQFLKVASIYDKQKIARQYLSDQTSLIKKVKVMGQGQGNVFVGLLGSSNATGGVTAATQGGFISSLFEMAGRPNVVARPAGKDSSTWLPMSLEGIYGLNPDSVILMTYPEDKKVLDDYTQQPLWKRLKAVQSGHVYNVSRGVWSLGRGPLAVQKILAEMAQGLMANRRGQ